MYFDSSVFMYFVAFSWVRQPNITKDLGGGRGDVKIWSGS